MSAPTSCAGGAQAQTRYRISRPALYCLRYHKPADLRCIDYRTRREAIDTTLAALKRPPAA